jgi:hypothetical protein
MNALKLNLATFATMFAIFLFAGSVYASNPMTKSETINAITEIDVVNAQKAWGEGIVKIGEVYTNGGDYTKAASMHIEEFYGYDMGKVLFKPTLAADKQFRRTFDGALSYFVGNNATYPEDKGFAIKPWTDVRWENEGIINNDQGNMAVAMGNYYFKTQDGDEVKVEYTFAYVKDANGDLKIVAHKSAIPYAN